MLAVFSALKTAYGRQVEGSTRLVVNHVSKEEFLTAHLEAYEASLTTSNAQTGFAATRLVPDKPDRIPSTLDPIVRESKTPRNCRKINRQANLIHLLQRQRRATMQSPSDPTFDQLLKGCTAVVHERAIALAENALLRTENKRQKRKTAQCRQTIAIGRTETIPGVQDAPVDAEMQEEITDEVRMAKIAGFGNRQDWRRRKAPPRCSKCGSFQHTARTCKVTL